MRAIGTICIISCLVDGLFVNASYIERRACAKTNIYRTLERLQRESSFCQALLAPNPTVTVPSSIAATPIQTISSACNCIVATLTTSTTSTTTPVQSPTRPVETVTLPASTVTLPASTVTESCTTTSTPTTLPSSYVIDFETPSRLWAGGQKGPMKSIGDDFITQGEHEDASEAKSGRWYYRWEWGLENPGQYIFRWGNKKLLPLQPQTNYRFTISYRVFDAAPQANCQIRVELGSAETPNIGGIGTVNSGFGIGPTLDLPASNTWTRNTWLSSSMQFNSRQFSGFSMFVSSSCTCSRTDGFCGKMKIGFDDISITVLAS